MGACTSSQAPAGAAPYPKWNPNLAVPLVVHAAGKKDAPAAPQQEVIAAHADSSLLQTAAAAAQAERLSSGAAASPGPAPSPLSEAPTEVSLPGVPASPFPAPFIPPPTLPPPESPTRAGDSTGSWRPARRRALLVGCSYGQGSGAHLRGSVNDAHCLRHLLTDRYGFQRSDIVLLHDQQPYAEFMPTRDNVLAAMRWLVGATQPGDSLFFGFSGRSAGPELGGLLPCDFDQVGAIFTETVHELLVAPLSQGARLHCAIDAVPNGLSLGLPHSVFIRQDGWADWEDAELPAQEGPVGCLSNARCGRVVLLTSACDAGADADVAPLSARLSTGAIAFSLVQAVEQGQGETYNTLLRAMRYSLKNGPQHFADVPDLSCSEKFDLNAPVLL